MRGLTPMAMATIPKQQRQVLSARIGKPAFLLLLLLGLLHQIRHCVAQSGVDEAALEDVMSNVTSDPHHAFRTWTPSTDVCNWEHVRCNADNRVSALNLSGQHLVGTMSSSLGYLEHLEYLNLEGNRFTGTIPTSLGSLGNLLELRLGNNQLEGSIPNEIGSIPGIYHINISRAGLTGPLPSTLGNLKNLSFMYFGNNDFSGTIPDQFGNLAQLEVMHLYRDSPVAGIGLTGEIPPSLGNLNFLYDLNVANNNLTGVLPDSFKGMRNMFSMNVSSNQLQGQIPVEIFSLPQLVLLDVSNNNFSGTFPNVKGLTFRDTNNPFLQQECSTCPTSPVAVRKKKDYLTLILGVLGGVTGFLLLAISIYFCRACFLKQQGDAKSAGIEPPGKTHIVLSLNKPPSSISERAVKNTRKFTIKELRAATRNFRPDNVIGEGGFGLVYRGTLSTGQEVAIKHAHKDAQQGHEEFYNEVELLSKVHHKYLVDLVGFCDEHGEQMLVYEFIPNGNLFEHLSGQRTPPLTWRQRVHIAICCAKALAHLHEGCTPSIIHRDIKPSNILLDNNLVAKVADFGLSKTGPVGGASHVSTGVKGTPGYLDPYYYLSWHLGAYSDVYSFGVILLQLVASKPAVDRKRKNRSNYSLVAWAKDCLRQGLFDDIVDPELRSQGFNRDVLLLMVKLGIRCTGEEIKDRPSMATIYKELERTLEKLGSGACESGSPEGSKKLSAQESLELAPESMVAIDDDGDEDYCLYSKINFDGKSWIDIKNLGEEHFEDLEQDNKEHMGSPNLHLPVYDSEVEDAKPII